MRMPSSPRSIVEDPSGRAISYFVPDVVWGLAIWRHNNNQKKSCGVGYSTYSQPRKTERKKKDPNKTKNNSEGWKCTIWCRRSYLIIVQIFKEI